METIEIEGTTYRILKRLTPDEVAVTLPGRAEQMRLIGIDYLLHVTDPVRPITYDERGQSSNIMIAYQKGDRGFWDIWLTKWRAL